LNSEDNGSGGQGHRRRQVEKKKEKKQRFVFLLSFEPEIGDRERMGG